MRKFVAAFAGLVIVSGTLLATAPSASASAMERPCADVEAIFARGSGQSTGGGEAQRFEGQLTTRISSSVTSLNYYELGTDAAGYGGNSYKAIDVGNVLNGNPVGAKFSGGYGFDYGRSVDSGVGELYNYYLQRVDKCRATGSRFVMAGYSQGAQVVGQMLVKLASETPGKIDRIDFAALLGDPKLFLPEGEGFYPPACRGKEFSTWRRDVPDCDTDNGSLGARKPYLPASISDKVGLWCNDEDFVCGSDQNPLTTGGHGKYKDPGQAIDSAVQEMAVRLRATLPPEKAAGVDASVILIGAGTSGLDVAFIIDTTGSMGPYIAQTKQFARSAAAAISELRGRVALTGYKDVGDSYTARVFSDLDSDVTGFQSALDELSPSGGGDTPEALLHGITTTLNGLEWRPGATKAAIVLTDAGFHQPDLVDGSTVSSVAARALEIDPVNVYAIVPEFLATEYQELTDLTSGQVIVNTGDTVGSLTSALTKIRNRPVPLLPLTEYFGEPGENFTFDGSRSYVVDSEIVSYEWDFDGDGGIDETTLNPLTTHVYPEKFDGVMQLRVTAADGGVANVSALVHVGTEQPGVDAPGAPVDLSAEVLADGPSGSTVRLRWTPADALAGKWAVSVNGVPVGLAAGSVTSVEITEVERTELVTFGVTGMTADGLLGETATVELPVSDPTPPGCTIVGTAGNDTLRGTSKNDVICGLGGNDVITGSAGDDNINGGSGNDRIDGGSGADVVTGGPGLDRVDGASGNDSLDTKDGLSGDTALGGSGIDTCISDAGDVVTGCP